MNRRFLLALALVVSLAGCSAATARKAIVSANEAQDAAAHVYDSAKATEADATRACVAVLKAKMLPLPAKADEIVPKCAAVGSPVPFDPVLLQRAAGPINALYDGIRIANAERLATGDNVTAATLMNLAALFEQVVADLASAGIPIPEKVKGAAAIIRGGS